MSWETTLYTSISYNRKTYENLYQVEVDIDECNNIIKMKLQELRDLATMTEPQKLLSSKSDDEYTTPLALIQNKFNEITEDLGYYYVERFKLEVLRDEWDKCHDKDGKAIPITKPNPIVNDELPYNEMISAVTDKDIKEFWLGNKAFLDGDFINTIYSDARDRL